MTHVASVRTAEIIWKSILEYGCEIWGDGDLPDFEPLQVEMCRRIILRCTSRITNEVVLGELGWERMNARRDEMRLRWVRMQDHRIPRVVYKQSKTRQTALRPLGVNTRKN